MLSTDPGEKPNTAHKPASDNYPSSSCCRGHFSLFVSDLLEWYGASSANVGLKMTAEEAAQGIVARSTGENCTYTVADPSMFAQSGGPSLAERMGKAGLRGLRRGDNRRVAQMGALGGWDQMRARIRGDGDVPMLHVFSTCREFIRTIPALQHDPDRPEDLDTSGEDHVADECRYACMSRPFHPIQPPVPKRDRVVLVADKYGQVHYEDAAGPVSVRDVVRNYCLRKERERQRERW